MSIWKTAAPAAAEAGPQPDLPSASSPLNLKWKRFSASQEGSASLKPEVYVLQRETDWDAEPC